MAEYLVTDSDMTKVADAIRAKGGTTEALAWPDGYKTAIEEIQTGGGGGGGVDEVDISFINAVNNSIYNGRMILGGVVGTIECNFTSNHEYTFELPNPIPINEFFNEFSAIFDTPTNYPIGFMLNIIDADTGQSGLVVRLMNA